MRKNGKILFLGISINFVRSEIVDNYIENHVKIEFELNEKLKFELR